MSRRNSLIETLLNRPAWDSDDTTKQKVWHLYRRLPARIGDTALCGWTKRRETPRAFDPMRDSLCVVCEQLRGGGEL